MPPHAVPVGVPAQLHLMAVNPHARAPKFGVPLRAQAKQLTAFHLNTFDNRRRNKDDRKQTTNKSANKGGIGP